MSRRRPSLLLVVGLVWLVGTLVALPGSHADPGTAPVVDLADPGALLQGSVTLTATVTPSSGRSISSVVFERSPAGADQWTTISTATTAPYTATLDTTALPNGDYDLRVSATDDASETGTSPVLTRAVQNARTPPTVSLADPGQFLRRTVPLTATATAAPGHTIVSVEFAYSPAATDDWTSLGSATVAPFQRAFDTRNLSDGPYDLRATATDDTGATASDVLIDRIVANSPESVQLTNPPKLIGGRTTLTGSVTVSTTAPVTVDFQVSPAGQRTWTTVAEVSATPKARLASTPVTATFDSTSIPDGPVDLRLTSTSPITPILLSPTSRSRVDNTAPLVSLTPVSSPLSDRVTLTATADDGTGAGVGAVRFEWSPAGSNAWTTIGTDGTPPYSTRWDTRARPNGSYDVRAHAIDLAGNEATATTPSPVEISNAPRPPATLPSIRDLAAPAHDLTLLGAVAGSSQHETWAYGFTSAAPAEVDGVRLPYTALGSQLVLLRYTDDTGWRIEDVLRDADGVSAFPLLPPGAIAQNGLLVRGTMASTGEGWLWIRETPSHPGAPDTYGLFHRTPTSKHFVLDRAATTAVGTNLLDPDVTGATVHSSIQMSVAPDGTPFGVLVSPGQQAAPLDVATTTVDSRIAFAILNGSTWTTQRATVPSSYTPTTGDTITLDEAAVDQPGSGFAVFAVTAGDVRPEPLLLSRFEGDNWSTVDTGLDTLDLSGSFAQPGASIVPSALHASSDELWLGATVHLATGDSSVVVRYDVANATVLDAWCALNSALRSTGCTDILDTDHPAAVPDETFATPDGEIALALDNNFVDLYQDGAWTRVATPGFTALASGAFFDPTDGWLAGANAFGRWLADSGTDSPLVSWSQANRNPLLAVALPPDSPSPADATAKSLPAGAVAVGLDGAALSLTADAGWLVTPLPPRASHVNLLGVSFAAADRAFAVGQFGTILRWDGTAWTEDPQTLTLTTNQLNAVAFGEDGIGYAVGTFGTILRFDGSSWSSESPPVEDQAVNISSVTVAGNDVFAVAGGNLIERLADGTWQRVPDSSLPTDPAPVEGDLRLVSGLPDGGVVAAGRSVALVRNAPGEPFEYAGQPIEGTAVALAAARDSNGDVRSFVSLSPAVTSSDDVQSTGFPSGDGELLRQTANGGWQDLSDAEFPGGDLPGDGLVKPDPVLGIAASPDGTGAWVVGGYAGTPDSAGRGTNVILSARPTGWRTSSIWRYDAGQRVDPPGLALQAISIPAQPSTVSFAFFSSALCKSSCSSALNAQPDVNLTSAAAQIAAFADQPGGPTFAVLGGDARGPTTANDWQAGNGAADLARLPNLLSPLKNLPLFAAYGPLDAVPNQRDPSQPWADAFSAAPAPFGTQAPAANITPVSSGEAVGNVHRYYAFDATQNGGTLRVVVIDNSGGSLEGTAAGQTDWLGQQLNDAQARGIPVAVVAALPLRAGGATDGNAVAAMLASAGVVAVFTTNYPFQLNERHLVPDNAQAGAPQVPEYEGAALGYQQQANNGVVWYDVSVDTAARQVHVDAIPVIDTLALKPLQGLTVNRSFTLQFEAVARRPVGSLATTTGDDSFPGFDSYVTIPAAGCGAFCVQPTYRFSSSDPTIGDFVAPSGAGSRFPQLDGAGHATPSATSGLFCAYNTGTTNVSITVGLLRYSLPVTVGPGGFGPPCGTVFRAGVNPIVHVQQSSSNPNAAPPPPPLAPAPVSTDLPLPTFVPPPPPPVPAPVPPVVVVPPPAPVPAPPAPAPAPAPEPAPAPAPAPEPNPVSPVQVVPPPVPPVQPIPPGGAVAQAPSAAPRKEKAHKHASQSAFTIRPAGTDGATYFFGATAASTLLLVALLGVVAVPRRRSAAVPASVRVPPNRH